MDAVRESGELALSMADMDARFGDYRDALTWLDVYAQRRPLPRSYEQKRRDWVERLPSRIPAPGSRSTQ